MGLLQYLQRHPSFAHGVRPPENKAVTEGKPIRRLRFPPTLTIPLSQHIGKPSKLMVQPGQEVERGEPIAQADGFLSVPIHAPAAGIVKGIELAPTVRGPKTEAIVLEVARASSQQVAYEYPREIDGMSPQELIRAVQETGMVGLGGAAFPTHVKMTIPEEHQVDTVVVNGCECEPYLTTDHRVMLEETDLLIKGISIAMRATGSARAMIAVEDNKLDAIEAIRPKLPVDGSITLHPLKTKYPQGAEKMIIKGILGREVPSGGLPSAVGVSVYNVGTLAQLGKLVPRGRGLIERVVTIAGPEIEQPGNYRMPLGTPVGFVLNELGYTGSAAHVILGGPMMGSSVGSMDVPVTKAVSGILVFNRKYETDGGGQKIHTCIKCAKCLQACPLNLNPSDLGLLAVKRRYETMAEDYNLMDCFECGCCSYVCPSNIPLVQYFRVAKSIVRERAA